MPINELDLLQFPELKKHLLKAQENPPELLPTMREYTGNVAPFTLDENGEYHWSTPKWFKGPTDGAARPVNELFKEPMSPYNILTGMLAGPAETFKNVAEQAGGHRPLEMNRITDAVADMAGLTVGGRYDPNVLNSIGSIRSATADYAKRTKALKMKEAGASQREIIQETGWWQDPDKNWVYEIPNTGAKYKHDPAATKVSEIYDDANLFAAYPALKDAPFSYAPQIQYAGDFNPFTKEIRLNKDDPNASGILNHETQHFVQNAEALAQGYGPRYAPPEVAAKVTAAHEKSISNQDKLMGNKALVDEIRDTAGIGAPEDSLAWEYYKAGDIADYVTHNPEAVHKILQRLQEDGSLGDATVDPVWLNKLLKNPERVITQLDANIKTANKHWERTLKAKQKVLENDRQERSNYQHALGEINAEVSRLRADYTPEQLYAETFPETRNKYIADKKLDPNKIRAHTTWGDSKNAVPQPSIDGWHGSPHKFKPVEHNPFGEFKDSAIGTGEGKQVYGRGHYIAGAEAVGKSYRDKLSRDGNFEYTDANGAAQETSAHYPWQVTEALGLTRDIDGFKSAYVAEHILNNIKKGKDLNAAIKDGLYNYSHYPRVIVDEAVAAIKKADPKINNEGSLYKVEIGVEPEQLLDWDKPLSQMPEAVQAALHRVNQINNLTNEQLASSHTGMQIHRMLEENFRNKNNSSEALSQALAEAGVPGIRYLDQDSRGNASDKGLLKFEIEQAKRRLAEFGKDPVERARAQEMLDAYAARLASIENPTSNYVIFDPKHLNITHRNGVPMIPVDHDPFK